MRYYSVLLLLLTACGPNPVALRFDEVNDRGLGLFTVVNSSDKDVASIGFEVVFRSAEGGVVSVDTIAYEMTTDASTGKSTAFVSARDETFFAWRMPKTSVSASGTVLYVEFFDGAEP